MMDNELKSKLTDILFKAAGGISDMAEDEVAQIHRAYRDAGYYTSPLVKFQFERIENGQLMPGYDWLTKFKIELEAERPYMSPGEYKHALAVAERVAS